MVKVSDKKMQLEGLTFDREGNLYFVEFFGGTIFKLSLPEKELTKIYQAEGLSPAAVKIHKDGRLFVACLGNFKYTDCQFTITRDGENFEMILPEEAGYVVDDLVFTKEGGFYFTDFKGRSNQPDGGVYYVSPDFQTLTQSCSIWPYRMVQLYQRMKHVCGSSK